MLASKKQLKCFRGTVSKPSNHAKAVQGIRSQSLRSGSMEMGRRGFAHLLLRNRMACRLTSSGGTTRSRAGNPQALTGKSRW